MYTDIAEQLSDLLKVVIICRSALTILHFELQISYVLKKKDGPKMAIQEKINVLNLRKSSPLPYTFEKKLNAW